MELAGEQVQEQGVAYALTAIFAVVVGQRIQTLLIHVIPTG